MTKLSVNINKIATLRNARGGNTPNLLEVAKDVQDFGAEGITIHPRPDQRHIKYIDANLLKPIVYTEYNIEGNPVDKFIDLVLKISPTQVTLVPDAIDAITSNAGWDTVKHHAYLKEIIAEFKRNNIRTSIFIDPNEKMIEAAAKTNTDRIELYTEAYAKGYSLGNHSVIEPYVKSAVLAHQLGMGVNAGHDLSLSNIRFFQQNIPNLQEVSIGHALVCESIYQGLKNVVAAYLEKLK